MNILHISPYYPSIRTNHAGGICMGKELETLKTRHNVYVLSFLSQDMDRRLYEEDLDRQTNQAKTEDYFAISINKITRAFHVIAEPWMPYYFAARSSLRFSIHLIRMVRKYHIDAIHAEYASMGQYLWIKKLFPKIRFNLIEHDMTAQSYQRKLEHLSGWKKVWMGLESKKILSKEAGYVKGADQVLTFNDKDKKLLEEYYGRKDVIVLNPYFGELETISGRTNTNRTEHSICFLGQMSRTENAAAAMRLIRICKRIKSSVPDLQVYIVGNKPSEELQEQQNDYIRVTGFVEDVDEYLRTAQLAVFPLMEGAGIKVKVLRALAVGTPVITGDIGAEGIDEEYSILIHAETDQEYEEAICCWLSEEKQTDIEQKSGESLRFVRKHFGWERSEKILDALYAEPALTVRRKICSKPIVTTDVPHVKKP